MINLIVTAISAIMFALLVVWWRWPAFRAWIEAPKYSMLCQERRFDDQMKESGMDPSSMAGTQGVLTSSTSRPRRTAAVSPALEPGAGTSIGGETCEHIPL
jgi:hypothetical protein